MTYAFILWGSCGKTLFNELERIQVRAAKIIYGLDWYTPSDEVLAHANWFSLYHLYKLRLLMLAHKCFYGTAPVSIQKYFKKYTFKYNLRRKLTFEVPLSKTDLRRKMFLLQINKLLELSGYANKGATDQTWYKLF